MQTYPNDPFVLLGIRRKLLELARLVNLCIKSEADRVVLAFPEPPPPAPKPAARKRPALKLRRAK